MAANVDRFRKDLDRLIQQGGLLDLAMVKEVSEDSFSKQARDQLGKKEGDALIKSLPNFKPAYEAWYSESGALLRQLLPDRVEDFVGLYQKPKG